MGMCSELEVRNADLCMLRPNCPRHRWDHPYQVGSPAMANPRWVSHAGVDSQAMLSVALQSATRDKALWDEMGIYGRMSMIMHHAEFGVVQCNLTMPTLRSVSGS